MRTGELNFEGQAYLLDFVLPNLFFHAHDHLRDPARGRRADRQDGFHRRPSAEHRNRLDEPVRRGTGRPVPTRPLTIARRPGRRQCGESDGIHAMPADETNDITRSLDKALADTFPASDPPSQTSPSAATPSSAFIADQETGELRIYRVIEPSQAHAPFAPADTGGRWSPPGMSVRLRVLVAGDGLARIPGAPGRPHAAGVAAGRRHDPVDVGPIRNQRAVDVGRVSVSAGSAAGRCGLAAVARLARDAGAQRALPRRMQHPAQPASTRITRCCSWSRCGRCASTSASAPERATPRHRS